MAARRTTRGSSRGAAALGLAVAVALSGCAPASDAELGAPAADVTTTTEATGPDAGADPDGTAEEERADRWVAAALPVHSRLTATDDSIVYAGVHDDELFVTALDPAGGTERWRRQSVVSDRVPGVELSILADDDTAYFLTDDGALELTAVVTATGEERWRSELSTGANPNVTTCGPDLCLFVSTAQDRQLWKIDRATGEVVDRTDASKSGVPADVAYVATSGGERSTYLTASRGPVVISQFTGERDEPDWSQPASAWFPGVEVGPNGGWAGWPVDDGGWVVWFGHDDGTRHTTEPGDAIPPGAVAGAGPDGTPQWLRTDRRPCPFAYSPTIPVLCDRESVATGPSSTTWSPTVMEGLDLFTGAATWSVALDGTIEAFDPAGAVLHVDDTTYVIATPDGAVKVDLVTGPSPAGEADAIGWCAAAEGFDPIQDGPKIDDYLRSGGEFPCRLGGEAVDEPGRLPVPDFAGVTAAGWSAWVVDATVHAQRVA